MAIYSQNLWQFFKSCENSNPPINIPMSSRYEMFEKIFAGLDYLQKNGFVHLDLKLSNILIKTNSAKNWDRKNLVLSDFGIGGTDLATLGKCGTPGFASPEQLVGNPHVKSDNYGFGRVMVYLFCRWDTAWDSLFQPITDAEFASLTPSPTEKDLFSIFTDLTKVRNIQYIILYRVRSKMPNQPSGFFVK